MTVVFTIVKNAVGNYTVDINGNIGQFNITLLPPLPELTEALPSQPSTNWWLYGGLIAGIIIVMGLFIFFFKRR